jgi:hypothetical protein
MKMEGVDEGVDGRRWEAGVGRQVMVIAVVGGKL